MRGVEALLRLSSMQGERWSWVGKPGGRVSPPHARGGELGGQDLCANTCQRLGTVHAAVASLGHLARLPEQATRGSARAGEFCAQLPNLFGAHPALAALPGKGANWVRSRPAG